MPAIKTYIPFSYLYDDIKKIVGENKANMIYEQILLRYPSCVIHVSSQEAKRIAYKNSYKALKRMGLNKNEIAQAIARTHDVALRSAYDIIKRIEEEDSEE